MWHFETPPNVPSPQNIDFIHWEAIGFTQYAIVSPKKNTDDMPCVWVKAIAYWVKPIASQCKWKKIFWGNVKKLQCHI